MTATRQLPDIGQILGALLQRVPVEQQPLLLALAERMAAALYREWADKVVESDHKSSLLACADREEEIARRAEAVYPAASSIQRNLLAENPDLADIRSIFAPLSLDDQFALLAQGERAGAATWRAYAEKAGDPKTRDVFYSFAPLEEENAAFLESITRERA